MSVQIIKREGKKLTIEITLELEGSLLEMEESIQKSVNELGLIETEEALKQFDTHGAPIVVGGVKQTSKGQEKKKVQTPYGEVNLARHVYQSSAGGQTHIPLERAGGLINGHTTPRFAKMISWKYSEMSSNRLIEDLGVNHGRWVSSKFVQHTMSEIGSRLLAHEKEWSYSLPSDLGTIALVSISRDGTTTPIKGQGYRETMNGTISLYDYLGNRVHTIYVAKAPEYGKSAFNAAFLAEIQTIKALYPKAEYVGLADGAPDNWTFLEPITEIQLLDFYHATEYLAKVSKVAFTDKSLASLWLEQSCHNLKHNKGAVKALIKEMKVFIKGAKKSAMPIIQAAITYFTNQRKRMKYHKYSQSNYPIGSGVVEAACKTITKQRLSNSGMRWNIDTVDNILTCRALTHTNGRWEQAWNCLTMAA